MACTNIDASWIVDTSEGVSIDASFIVSPGFTDIDASWAVDAVAETFIDASWVNMSLADEAYTLFVDQPPLYGNPNPNAGVTPTPNSTTYPTTCSGGISTPLGSGSTAPPISLNNFYSYGFKIELVGDVNYDFSPYQLDFTITQNRNAPATLTFRLADYDHIFSPEATPYGGTGAMLGDFHTGGEDSTVVNRYYQVTVKVGEQTWVSPRFLQLDYDWSHNGKVGIVTINASDYSELLLANQDTALDDYVSGSAPTGDGRIWTASAIMADFLPKFGVGSFRLEFTDYPVPRFSPKGRNPFEWFKELVYGAQAEWYFDGDTLVVQDRNTANVAWTLEDIYHLANFKYKKTSRGIYNESVINKQEVTSNVVAENHCKARSCIGLQSFTWDQGINAATFVVDFVLNGSITEIFWMDQEGNFLNTSSSGTYFSNTPMYGVQFVYEPNIGIISPQNVATNVVANSPWGPDTLPEYVVSVVGRPINTDPLLGTFDREIKIRKKSDEHQALFGVRKSRAVNTPIIATREAAERFITLLLEESLRKAETIQTNINMLNPYMRPAQSVKFKVGQAGFSQGLDFYVESITKTGNSSGGTMSINASRFLYEVTSAAPEEEE